VSTPATHLQDAVVAQHLCVAGVAHSLVRVHPHPARVDAYSREEGAGSGVAEEEEEEE